MRMNTLSRFRDVRLSQLIALRRHIAWPRLAARLRYHAVSLVLVLCACVAGQIAAFVVRPIVVVVADTPTYMRVTERILNAFQFFDTWRTPGYPAFLALIFVLARTQTLGVVVVVQATLIVIASAEIYWMTYRISGSRWQAVVVSALVSANPFTTNWERMILTEVLSYFLTVTLFVMFFIYLRNGRLLALGATGLACAYIILVRPQFIFLPLVLIVVLLLRHVRARTLTRIRWEFGLTCILPLLLILGYCVGNAVASGYFGMTKLTNLNLFGKVLEYHMVDMSGIESNQNLMQFRAVLDANLRTDHPPRTYSPAPGVFDPTWNLWHFVDTHPQYDANNWHIYGEFSTAIIAHHPLYFLRNALQDVVVCGYAGPVFGPFDYYPGWIVSWWALFGVLASVSAYLPILVLATFVGAWKRPENAGGSLILALMLTVAGNIVLLAFTDFTEYGRLRFPVDWAVTLVGVVLLVGGIQKAASVLAKIRNRRSGATLT